MPAIWLIGDSTVDDNKPPFRGWGWALPEYVREGVVVKNHGLSGTSTKSFRDQGLFQPVEDGMRAGDLLLIQFGHNDEKEDAERHTDPDTTYRANLKAYCDAALAKGTAPVLLTPVSRRFFLDDGVNMLYTHGEYPGAVRRLAADEGIALCDLKQLSRDLYLSLKADLAEKLFVVLAKGEHPDFPDGHADKTHFNAIGAAVIAKLVADDLRRDERFREYFL